MRPNLVFHGCLSCYNIRAGTPKSNVLIKFQKTKSINDKLIINFHSQRNLIWPCHTKKRLIGLQPLFEKSSAC